MKVISVYSELDWQNSKLVASANPSTPRDISPPHQIDFRNTEGIVVYLLFANGHRFGPRSLKQTGRSTLCKQSMHGIAQNRMSLRESGTSKHANQPGGGSFNICLDSSMPHFILSRASRRTIECRSVFNVTHLDRSTLTSSS